jgi:hypothetical protein
MLQLLHMYLFFLNQWNEKETEFDIFSIILHRCNTCAGASVVIFGFGVAIGT